MIETEESNNWVKIRLPAEFNFKLHREFRESYIHRPPGLCYEIDFKAVTTLDSAAMGMLLLMRKQCGDEDAIIHLVNGSSKIVQLLKLSKFDLFFTIPQ
ncbi:MAG: STAS domain-containing protein [Magnetococcales bacterium]|nr:STAS domain-containing protein [Magnetococcales bacterium]